MHLGDTKDMKPWLIKDSFNGPIRGCLKLWVLSGLPFCGLLKGTSRLQPIMSWSFRAMGTDLLGALTDPGLAIWS